MRVYSVQQALLSIILLWMIFGRESLRVKHIVSLKVSP